MNHLRLLGEGIPIDIPVDEEGFTGRECPNPDCDGYFKIVFGTGLEGEKLPCHCPYCGHTAPHDQFWTQEQIQYVRSVALRKISDAFRKDLKALEFDHKPRGGFGIGISMKVEFDRSVSIHRYREPQLETAVVCSHCTLRYAVYGVFGFCPDCGEHNSLQILNKNLDLVMKMVEHARTLERELSRRLIESALEGCVAAFDGFGRELCRVYAKRAGEPESPSRVSFQNLEETRKRLERMLGVDALTGWSEEDWQLSVRLFQKRHLIAHKMGVVDQEYVSRTGDRAVIVGRRVAIDADEIQRLAGLLSGGAGGMSNQFRRFASEGEPTA